eukprot:COSAG04_NODE_777_length_10358_cov_1284.125061_6_plen_50_part_00
MGGELGLGCENAALPDCSVSKQDLEDLVSFGIDRSDSETLEQNLRNADT